MVFGLFIPLVEDANLLQQVLYHRDTLIDKMPRAGFKSITVSDYVYNRFFGTYERTRRDLELKGITSFSGYLTSMMDEIMTKYETFSRHAPFMEKIDV
ncbi:MAG: hypothetical protein WAQ29_11175, partial [Nitrososphaeraceae archaeon]